MSKTKGNLMALIGNNSSHVNKIRICLIVEGAYPYIVGGVSIWLHQLIENLPDIEFVIWTIVPEKGQKYKFKLPDNVVDLVEIALSDKLHGGKRKHKTQSQWNIIHDFHDRMNRGDFSKFERFHAQFSPDELQALTPENIFKDFQGWELITKKYNLNHPISPFIDYYWAWRAIHIPIIQMMQTTIPEADIYHAISTGYAGLLGVIAKLGKNRPLLLTEHGIYAKEREIEINQSEIFKGYQKRMWKKSYQGLANIAYQYADSIIALFRRNQEIQIQMGAPREKCRIIPNGIHIQDFENLPRKPHKGCNVGFIGRMVAIKDVKNFLMAARIIKDKIPDAVFYLIGPRKEQKEYYAELEILADNLYLIQSLKFTGRVDVKDYFPILDVMCLTSIKEAQPLSVIEAMMAGVAVVATDVGDVSDLLRNDGIVVPPKSPDKLAEGVIEFVRNPGFRETCTNRARKRALREYNLNKLIKKYDDIYHRYSGREEQKWRA